MGLLFTLILGIFIIIGSLIVFLTKNNDKFVEFSISLAFGVMMMLIIVDLIPEAFEIIDYNSIWVRFSYIGVGALIGFLFLKLFW